MAIAEMKEKLLKDYEQKISEVNKVCLNGTNAEVEGKLNELTNIEKEFRAIRQSEVFAGLLDVHQALELHHFETISHRKVSTDGQMTGVEKTMKDVQIDLRRFCEVKGFDLGWYYEMQALNKRLTLKIATDLGIGTTEIRKINDSYNMEKLAEQIDLGKTPTSNTQIVKHMQKVLDTLSPDEGRVNSYDLAYVLACYTKRNNKASLRVTCSKHDFLQSLLTDVFHRVVTDGVYSVDYKRNPQKAAEVVEEKPEAKKAPKKAKKVSAPKAEEVSEPAADTIVAKKDKPAA